MTYLAIALSFALGLVIGVRLNSAAFDGQDWTLMRWDNTMLGYRPIKLGSTLTKTDRIIMSLEVNTSAFPKDGVKYTNEE
jgi:hypothetical protein|tara:strand:- start:3103 stop:3342 length:240 start_codon:yes stop_codon:yes gene_type:complete